MYRALPNCTYVTKHWGCKHPERLSSRSCISKFLGVTPVCVYWDYSNNTGCTIQNKRISVRPAPPRDMGGVTINPYPGVGGTGETCSCNNCCKKCTRK